MDENDAKRYRWLINYMFDRIANMFNEPPKTKEELDQKIDSMMSSSSEV